MLFELVECNCDYYICFTYNKCKFYLAFLVEIEEGQILSFTRGKVTVWNAIRKTTESDFILDRNADVSDPYADIRMLPS